MVLSQKGRSQKKRDDHNSVKYRKHITKGNTPRRHRALAARFLQIPDACRQRRFSPSPEAD